MKKKHLKYAVLCFGLASMLAFAGCGSKGDDATTANPTETEATTEAVTVATTEATTEAQPEKDKDGFTICNDKVKTLDYVNVRTSPYIRKLQMMLSWTESVITMSGARYL